MLSSFVERVFSGVSGDVRGCVGYSETEMSAIARLYDISVTGQLSDFLSVMGRSDGGWLGDSIIQLYRPAWRVREHLLFQEVFLADLRECGGKKYLNRPFVFSFISDSQYYFVQSGLGDQVFHYDSNEESVCSLSYDLRGFLNCLLMQLSGERSLATSGDLLKI
ncbi:SMI1/KNR4 family protein [Pseudomonas muyukensis]|jgi:hypothetical protein|uniref:SMI1/KNR4 family protein n=1 Tax=Pseudomonas muyukensis TaxID=2842357 RepID=A0ABX8M704_9PSED|nr:SMI1/KNR4 family protein [Pseudomonas muyukensis]QXH34166.1 SMI1/KNR4 family protein [Pseudomonas muyukensis]